MRPDLDKASLTRYFDNASTTCIDNEVMNAMLVYQDDFYGNAHANHNMGRKAAEAIENAREQIANLLGVSAETIFFTSGATEANNWVIRCVKTKENHSRNVICSAIEHPSVMNSCDGSFNLYPIEVDKNGVIKIEKVEDLLQYGVRLMSLQHVNHEIGVIQPIQDVAQLCKKYDILCHTDASQSFGKLDLWPKVFGVDFVTLSSHKIYGPMGIGALYIRDIETINPFMLGGNHEQGMRAGTLNVPAIVGFGKAAELAYSKMRDDLSRVERFSAKIISAFESQSAIINGKDVNCSPYIISATFPGIPATVLSALLDEMYGICVSYGATCNSKYEFPKTILAMGKNKHYASSTIRISLGRFNTEHDVQVLIDGLHAVLREAKIKQVF